MGVRYGLMCLVLMGFVFGLILIIFIIRMNLRIRIRNGVLFLICPVFVLSMSFVSIAFVSFKLMMH